MRIPRAPVAALVAVALCVVASTDASASRIATLKLRAARFEHTARTVNDWASLTSKVSVVVGRQDGAMGLTTLRANGKVGPFRPLRVDTGEVIEDAVLLWPTDQRVARGRPPTGLVATAVRPTSGFFPHRIETSLLRRTGKAGGARIVATLEDARDLDLVAAYGDAGAVLVACWVDDSDGERRGRVHVYHLDLAGRAQGAPTELFPPGNLLPIEIRARDLVATDDGWVLLVEQRPKAAGADDTARLVRWFIPESTARIARSVGEPVEEPKLPPGASGFRYLAGQFLPATGDHGPLLFYMRSVVYPHDYARARGLNSHERFRFLRDATTEGEPAGPPREVAVEPWAYEEDIIASPSSHSFGVFGDTPSHLFRRAGGDYVFVNARYGTHSIVGVSSFRDPRQEYSAYALDPTNGTARLLARREVKNTPGNPTLGVATELIRPFGPKILALFHETNYFALESRVLIAPLPR